MVGKRVRGDVYVHRDAAPRLEPKLLARLEQAISIAPAFDWNVVRVGSKDVSLLRYQDFDAVAFPTLLESLKVTLEGARTSATNYERRTSRPILHRKELLLSPDDPRIPKFAALTRSAEERGLFQETNAIGTSSAWDKLLADKGLEVRGAEIVERGAAHVEVARHRTALARRNLSQPMALMLRLGMLPDEGTVFDYGCGQGDDITILQTNGYQAFGWDPHFNKDGERRPADIVNLGFVLNVIENPLERVETLRAAWSFVRKALIVSVMVRATEGGAWRPYKDGVVTTRGTFQKYFSSAELRGLVEAALGQAPITLAPGIVAVFRDNDLEQEVAYRRRAAASQYMRVLNLELPERAVRTARESAAQRDIAAIAPKSLEAIVEQALALGRLPAASELSEAVRNDLANARISAARALTYCAQTVASDENLRRIANARREDLLVHFALSFFPGAPRYSSLPRSIQLDVRTFFQSHNAMLAEARKLLFSLGEEGRVTKALAQAIDGGLGGLRGVKGRFVASVVPRLPAELRLIIGCGEVLDPDLAAADFFDIYPDGGRVRGLWCEDASSNTPVLTEMADIFFGRLKAHRRNRAGEVVYDKGVFLPFDDPNRAEQVAFDQRLREMGIVDADGEGPRAAELAKALKLPT
jgi:DNA phosphorothioation-associated putative methyltransferase